MSNSKKIKGLLFDFNGTLFFDSQLHIEAFKRYFVEHGKEEPTEEYITQQIFGKNNSLIYAENFNPKANATRAEVAVMCARLKALIK